MPTITIASDLGQQDYLLAAIKGQLLAQCPGAVLVDVTHQLNHSNYHEAAYLCGSAYRFFPEGTVHLLVLDMFANLEPHFLATTIDYGHLICPDNGILTMLSDKMPKGCSRVPYNGACTLLDMTDCFARTATEFLRSGIGLHEGNADAPSVEKPPLRPLVIDNCLEGHILYIDRYENAVTNITKDMFEAWRKGRKFTMYFSSKHIIREIKPNYAHGKTEGDYLAVFNSAGHLELSVKNGNMASMFGLQSFNANLSPTVLTGQNKWFYQSVKIYLDE